MVATSAIGETHLSLFYCAELSLRHAEFGLVFFFFLFFFVGPDKTIELTPKKVSGAFWCVLSFIL